MEIEPPPECFVVSVTPDGGSGGSHLPNTTGHSKEFTIENLGQLGDTYTLACSSSGPVTCTGLSQSSVAVGASQSTIVTAYYSVGASGTGSLSVTATGSHPVSPASDGGSYTITVHTMGVAVTPDGQVTATRPIHTSGHSASFTVQNTGTGADTYTLTCAASGSVTCGSVTPSSANLGGSGSTSISVSYSVGNVGTGTLTLTATGTGVNDAGSYSVPVVAPAGAPVVDATPYAFDLQNNARCAQACFAATYAQSTVSYVSLDAPRNVTLAYNGDRVDPKVFAHVNVRPDTTYGQSPTEYRLEVKVNGASVTFVNGEPTLRFAYPGSTAPVRLGGEFSAASYATNAYPLDISVSAYYASGTLVTNTWKTKLVVVNETGSPIARGWTLAGIQRLHNQSDSSALVTEGDGSAVYFAKSGGTFASPAGEFSRLLLDIPGGGSGWTRLWPDSTKVVFNSSGRMIEIRDRFNNLTTIVYDGSNRVSKVRDR